MAARDIVEYTLPPMPPMSGLMASSLDSPLDEKDDTEPPVDNEIKLPPAAAAAITTAGVWPAATAATIAAPASRAIKAVGKKGYPLMSIM